jgi:hypothetical protein
MQERTTGRYRTHVRRFIAQLAAAEAEPVNPVWIRVGETRRGAMSERNTLSSLGSSESKSTNTLPFSGVEETSEGQTAVE